MEDRSFKVVFFNALAVIGVLVGLVFGVIQPFFKYDASYLTYVMAGLLSMNIFLSTYDSFRPRKWIRSFIKRSKGDFLFIGVAGTIFGFSGVVNVIAQAATANGDAAVISSVFVAFSSVLHTAFAPTLIGIVSFLWTRRIIFLMD